MEKFALKLTVTEFYDSIEIEAESREEAEEKLARMWEDGEIEADGVELDFADENEMTEGGSVSGDNENDDDEKDDEDYQSDGDFEGDDDSSDHDDSDTDDF